MTGNETIIGLIIGMGIWVGGLTWLVVKYIHDDDDIDFE